jgi:ISXO2 transposase-like protein
VPPDAPQPGVDYPRSFHELTAWFGDDQACVRHLERVRRGDGFACRFCGAVGRDWWAVRRGPRRCAVCRRESSVTARTIFHGSRLPLQSWFASIWYVVNQKQGVSALGLQRVLGFGSYQTAWAWLHKLRRATGLPGRELLAGAVELDESYIGAARSGKRGRGAQGKAIVAIAVEDHNGAPGRTRLARIPNVKCETLTDFVLDHIARGTEVRTDAYRGYIVGHEHLVGLHAADHAEVGSSTPSRQRLAPGT